MTDTLGLERPETCACVPECAILWGTCHCGCGEQTSIALQGSVKEDYSAGQPKRFIRGHSGRKITHGLSEIDETMRTATCSVCGPVSIRNKGRVLKNGQKAWGCVGRLLTEHYLVNIEPLTQTADCRGCGGRVNIVKKTGRENGWGCANKQQSSAAEYRKANADRITVKHRQWREEHVGYRDDVRNKQLQALYGVTLTEYREEVARREGKCDICSEVPQKEGPNGVSLCVDHDHEDGHVRGYLDRDCNSGLGSFRDDPLRLARGILYLKPTDEQINEIIKRLEWFRDVRGIVAAAK